MVDYDILVRNPKSGRHIKKGGMLHRDLTQQGVVFPKAQKKRPTFQPKEDASRGSNVKVNPYFSVDRSETS